MNDTVKLPEQVPEVPDRARTAPSSDERLAADLRGFGPVGILAIIVIHLGNLVFLPLGAILVFVWVRLTRTPWREIGYVRPRSWAGTAVVGIVLGCAFKLLMKAIVMPLLGADAVNPAYHYLVGNRAALPWALYMFVIGGGFGEETVFRGFLFERLGKLLGTGGRVKIVIVLLTAGWFALAHYAEQGIWGSVQAMFTGTVFGTIFAITGRVWLPMMMHAAFDVTALAIIYWDLESTVAHLIWK